MSSPHIKYLLEDCLNERQVDKRYHSKLPLSQILFFFQIKMNIHGFQEDGSEVVEQKYLNQKEVTLYVIHWTKNEDDIINQRINPIIEHTSS